MRLCFHCQAPAPIDRLVSRQAQCDACGTDLHVCLNCVFYERGAYNDCRESQADRVVDKNRSNFCDYFSFRESDAASPTRPSIPVERLEALFKK